MAEPAGDITVGYLVNQYPAPSHSFIRREILALESHGVAVKRYSLRPAPKLVDPSDIDENTKTRAVLGTGALALLGATLAALFTGPVRFARALMDAVRLGRRSEVGVVKHLAYLAEACLLLRWMRRDGVEHLHAHFGSNPTAVAMLAHLMGGPGFSFTLHGAADFDRLPSLYIDRKIAAAKFVVAVSRYGRGQLCRYCPPQRWGDLHVVHCGVDDSYLEMEPTPVADESRFVCVGRLSPEKGQTLLVDAAAKLKQRGVDFRIVLVGDGDLRPRLEAAASAGGINGELEFAGWADHAQIRDHLSRARALVVPSFTEGLPVVIMEAFAMGRPVIASTVAGVPELVHPGRNGWLTIVGDADSLADALAEAAATPVDTLSDMGLAGRATVHAQHNATTEAGKLAALFQAAVAPGA